VSFGLNWLDIVIVVVLALALLLGIRSGLIRSIFGIVGTVLGIVAAILFYIVPGIWLAEKTGMPHTAAYVLSFIAIFSVIAVLIHLVGLLIHSIINIGILKTLNKIGGGLIGLAIGLLVIGIIMSLLISFPVVEDFRDTVENSFLGSPIVETATYAYDKLDTILPITLPKINFQPEEMNLLYDSLTYNGEQASVDFLTLEGSTCFACGNAVEFVGFLENGKGSISPKFVCPGCGRTSDGCQTYEGYHLLYDKCPVTMGNQGYRLDCGIWTNYNYIRPSGPCPVCN